MLPYYIRFSMTPLPPLMWTSYLDAHLLFSNPTYFRSEIMELGSSVCLSRLMAA